MKPCQFMLALRLFYGVFTTLTSTIGSSGFSLVLIEPERGDRLFNEPEVHTACEEQTEVVCRGTAAPSAAPCVVPPSRWNGESIWEPGACRWTPEIGGCWAISCF